MEATSASSSRVNASDLNGPGSSAPQGDFTHPDRRERRASPSYDAAAAARQQSNGNGNGSNWRRLTPERALGRQDDYAQGRSDRQYDSRPQQQRNNYGGNRGSGGGNADFFASRQAERDASNFSIWPPSPKTPRNDESEDERERRKRKKDKKHKSYKSSSSRHKKKRYSSETESESEDDDDKHRRSKKRRSSKHRHSDDRSDSEERRRHKDKKRSSKHRDESRSRSRSRTAERIHNDQEDEWAEKGGSRSDRSVPGTSLVPSTAGADKSGLTSSKGKGKETGGSDSDSDDVGPKPLAEAVDKHNPKDYGGALLRGEGAAMAAYVTEGARIPRRGEIGLESEQITKYEDVGYVMSGSRHRRMNAVRMRKENQVITAEEKRQMLKTQKEEQDKKETMVVSSFKELLEQRLQGEKRKQRDDY